MDQATEHTGDVVIDTRAESCLIRIIGEVDLSNAASVRQQILAALPPTGPGVVIDLTATTYLDSTGVRLLFELAHSISDRDRRLVLVVSEAALIRRVVVLTKLDDCVPIVGSHDEALRALAAPSSVSAPGGTGTRDRQ